ncbi:hypothetical protein Ancab_028761 [Ancistrocladus abbreviatus]
MKQPATGIPVHQAYAPPSPSPAAPLYQGDSEGGRWSSGLCGCFSDVRRCCLTCWCPCITFGQIAEIVDKGSSSCGVSGALYGLLLSLTGCQWIYSCTYRTKMKKLYGIPPNTCGDCCIHFWCEYCALCQEYRELQRRGFEPSYGWYGNIDRQNRGVAMTNAPMMQNGMIR